MFKKKKKCGKLTALDMTLMDCLCRKTPHKETNSIVFQFKGKVSLCITNWPWLTLSAQQTKTDTCANSVDPDETARNGPSHQDLHYLPFGFFDYTLKPLFEAVDMSKFKDGRVHYRNSGMKGLTLDILSMNELTMIRVQFLCPATKKWRGIMLYPLKV